MRFLRCAGMSRGFGFLLTALLSGGIAFAENVQVAPADTPQRSIRSVIPAHAIAAAWIKPASLIRDTEFEILGDIPFLGQLPIPPSEIEEVAVWAELDPQFPEPVLCLAMRFRHEIHPSILVHWLSPGAVEIEGSQLASFRHGAGGGSDLVFRDPFTVLMLPNADFASHIFSRFQTSIPPDSLGSQFASLPESVNFAMSVDVGQIRQAVDPLCRPTPDGSFVRLLLSLPVELSQVHLTAEILKRGSHLDVHFTKRRDVADSGNFERWLPSASQAVAEMIQWSSEKIQKRLSAEEDAQVVLAEQQILTYLQQLKPSPESPAHWTDPRLPSISRTMKDSGRILLPFILMLRHAARDSQRSNNFKQILLGWTNFEDQEKRPPTNIVDSQGKPLLSWRVRLLPFLTEEALYAKFHLDEPWDSPHNLELLAAMPSCYRNPFDRSGKPVTHFRAWDGPNTIFGDGATLRNVTDGSSQTIVIAETLDSVPWTKPEDLLPTAQEISKQVAPGQRRDIHIGFPGRPYRTSSIEGR
ncbi:DUF1559 domain-containing protein [Planctomicrobium sp. SH661]|uniref:DUF1559 family PulG-like putative transporter n=1 Tax=Planctomicrobium sp. SH661 TaxID=3448124 RepID=UPI003F5CABC5